MTTIKHRMTTALARTLTWQVFALAVLAVTAYFAPAQDEPVPPQRARQALRLATDLYKAGNFEKAEEYFNYAQIGKANLTTPEQQDLATFASQNNIALKSKQDGAVQIRFAEEAIQQGRIQDAAGLLKALNGNQHLSPLEKQQVAELKKRLQGMPVEAPAKGDAKSLLNAGRAALLAGDLAGAESLALQAEKAGAGLMNWMQPWNDSPAKLRRDVQNAKAKQQEPIAALEHKDSSWLPSMKWFGKSEKPAPADPDPRGPELASSDTKTGGPKLMGSLWLFGGSGTPAAKKDPLPPPERVLQEKIARHMVADGYRALEVNNVEMARQFALKAKELQVTFGPNEPTPDSLLHEIQRRAGNPSPAAPSAGKPGEDPTKIGDPRAMVRLGRSLLQQMKYDEADKLCNQAQAGKVSWGLFEDTPEKLRRDIQRLRQASDREESFKIMAEARKLYVTGNIEESEKKAYIAQKLHGPYGAFDFGDRPGKLLEEIQKTKLAKGPGNSARKDLPDGGALAKGGPDHIGPPPGLSAEMQNANKNRAILMVRAARELERQGMFVEARHKALEARELKAIFHPDEDSPDAVLLGVSARCEKQIQSHLMQATEQVASGNDPRRFESAHAHLNAARKLAQAFSLDTGRIEQTAHYLQQASAAGKAAHPVPLHASQLDPPTGDPRKDALRKVSREKLQDAQTELAHGKFAAARKMAEELYHQPHGLQDEVLRLLRSISAEEYNQQVLEARRTFDAGLEAYTARNYQKAMFIFQSVDPALLSGQLQVRMRDIMATREMQPQSFMLVQHREVVKGNPLTEPKGIGALGSAQEDPMEEYKRKESVQFQHLRQRGVEVLRSANELFNNKRKDQQEKAIDTLKNYLEQVQLAQLEPAKSNELRRVPEARIQQYKNMMDLDRLADKDKKDRVVTFFDESKRVRDKSKQQEEVYEKMKYVNELIKQNKLKDALAEVNKVVEVDPDNVAARMSRQIIDTRLKQEAWDKDELDNRRWIVEALPHRLGPVLDTKNPVEFDKDTTMKRAAKGGSGGIPFQLRDEKERAIDYRLRQPISLHFKDVPLQQAIRDIAATSGVQVVPDLGPLQQAKINLEAPLTISVEDIAMKSALNILLSPMGLAYVIEDQVLKITTEDRTKGRLVRVTYPIADLVVAVENHPLADVLDIKEALKRSMTPTSAFPNFMAPPGFPMSSGMPVSSHADGLGAAYGSHSSNHGYSLTQPPGTTGKRTPEAMADHLMTLVQNAISKKSWENMGGTGNIQYFPFGMALIVNQTQEVHEEVVQLLASLRKLQDLQVSVELRAVLVSEVFFERIGMDFDMNIRTPTSRREPDLINGTFVSSPFANRTADKLNGFLSGLTSAGTLTPDFNIPIRNSTFNFTTPQFGGYNPEAGLSLGLAFLSDIQVFMFMEAVQGDRRAHIMQAPRITVYNGQQANIGGLMFRPTVTSLTPTVLGNNTVVMIPQITQIPFGLTMTVQPVVSPDRRFIRLNVQPQAAQGQTDPAGAISITIPQGNLGAPIDGGGTQPAFANNPFTINFIPTQTNLFLFDTTVNVPDGGTVLLGGFKFVAEERSEYGPPVLSKIPYISRLFRNVGWSRDGSTLIYLVTARVIMVEEEEQLFLGNIAPIPGR